MHNTEQFYLITIIQTRSIWLQIAEENLSMSRNFRSPQNVGNLSA